LLAAVVRVTAAKGYEAMSVADILAEAGVGRESFYDLFDDKRDCVLAAHTVLIDHLEATVRAIYDEPGPWVDRVRRSLAAMLEWFATDPAAARVAVVELAAVGPESRERFQEIFERFSRILEEGRKGAAAPDPSRPHASELAIGAGLARVYEEVVRGRTAELPNLLPELTYEVLVPFIGEEAARAEERRAAEMVAAR
jgi:AcrR family transcriptional regulator